MLPFVHELAGELSYSVQSPVLSWQISPAKSDSSQDSLHTAEQKPHWLYHKEKPLCPELIFFLAADTSLPICGHQHWEHKLTQAMCVSHSAIGFSFVWQPFLALFFSSLESFLRALVVSTFIVPSVKSHLGSPFSNPPLASLYLARMHFLAEYLNCLQLVFGLEVNFSLQWPLSYFPLEKKHPWTLFPCFSYESSQNTAKHRSDCLWWYAHCLTAMPRIFHLWQSGKDVMSVEPMKALVVEWILAKGLSWSLISWFCQVWR